MVCYQNDFSCCDQRNLIASKLWSYTSYCQSTISLYCVIIYNLTCCSDLCSYVLLMLYIFVLLFNVLQFCRHFQSTLYLEVCKRLDHSAWISRRIERGFYSHGANMQTDRRNWQSTSQLLCRYNCHCLFYRSLVFSAGACFSLIFVLVSRRGLYNPLTAEHVCGEIML